MTILGRATPRRFVLALTAALAMFGLPGSARAEASEAQRAEARSLANEAANAYARGDYAEADRLFGRAYSLVPAPTIALLHARTLVKLGRLLHASAAYDRGAQAEFAIDAPEAFRRAAAEAREEGAALRARLPRLQITLSAVRSSPTARVLLDGQPVPRARLGTWIALEPKAHTIEVEQGGAIVLREEVVLAEGESRLRVLALPDSQSGERQRLAGWISLGAGGVGLAVGLGTGLAAVGAHSDAERACAERLCAPGSPGARSLQRFYDYRAVSSVAYAAGAVGLGLGTVLLLTAPRGNARLAISPTLGGLRMSGAL